jgi:tetratricopeptide (TPR) repeat protein
MADSLAKLEKAHRENPDLPLFARLADLYLRRGRVPQALSLCEKGCERFPWYPTGYLVLSQCYEARGAMEAARRAMGKALLLDPDNPAGFKRLARIYQNLGRAELALKSIRRAARMDPLDPELAERFDELEYVLRRSSVVPSPEPFDVLPQEVVETSVEEERLLESQAAAEPALAFLDPVGDPEVNPSATVTVEALGEAALADPVAGSRAAAMELAPDERSPAVVEPTPVVAPAVAPAGAAPDRNQAHAALLEAEAALAALGEPSAVPGGVAASAGHPATPSVGGPVPLDLTVLTDTEAEIEPAAVLDQIAAAVDLDVKPAAAVPEAVDDDLTASAAASASGSAADATGSDPERTAATPQPDLGSDQVQLPSMPATTTAVELPATAGDESGLAAAAPETKPGAAPDDLAISLAVRDEQELVRLLNEIEAEDAVAPPPPIPAAPEPPPPSALDEGETFIIATATLAEIYLQQGLAQRAMETYRQVLAHNPGNEAARQRLAELEQSARA